MSRVERHAAEEAARHGRRNKKQTEPVSDFYAEQGGSGKRGKAKKPPMTFMGRLLSLIGTLLMIAAILVCLGLAVPRFAGVDSYVVISGSMEPEIPAGSMIYSQEADPASLETGDIIVFYDKSDAHVPITHRIVENHTDAGMIVTKGDANPQNDKEPVEYANVAGKVIYYVPRLGYIASPLVTTMGKIAIGMVILAGFLLTEVGTKLRRKR